MNPDSAGLMVELTLLSQEQLEYYVALIVHLVYERICMMLN